MKKSKKPKSKSLSRPLKRARDLANKSANKLAVVRKDKTPEKKISDALADVPRITNETVNEHREEVLSSARKYIYPLQHSKHRVVKISISLFLAVVIIFFAVTGLELYKFQATSGFFYDVTSIIPYPVAKAGSSWVSYDSYLFELRHNIHYYTTQQQASFKGPDGQAQLNHLKQQAMAQVIQNAYVKQLASANKVSVSDQDVNNELSVLQAQNRLGNSQESLQSALKSYFGWNISDFKRKIRQELLSQAVVAKLDTATDARARSALAQLQHGTDFGTLASQISDDPTTKGSGGEYPFVITTSTSNVSPIITNEVFKLKPGQISGIINTGFTLEIIKVIDSSNGSAHVSHIQFNFKDISAFTGPLQTKHPSHTYISVK